MGKIWQRVKCILRKNLINNLKSLIERIGIWLIGSIEIGILVMIYIFSGLVVDPFLSNSLSAFIAITGTALCFGVGKIFKNGKNGNGNGHSIVPQ